MARELGRLEEAQGAYREGLELRRKILAMTRETPQALRDVSVSLNRVGDVARRSGRLEPAEQAYRESAAVCRALREGVGDSRQVLDDLAYALVELRRTLNDLGRRSEGDDQLREARALLERLSVVYSERGEYQNRLKAGEALIEHSAGQCGCVPEAANSGPIPKLALHRGRHPS